MVRTLEMGKVVDTESANNKSIWRPLFENGLMDEFPTVRLPFFFLFSRQVVDGFTLRPQRDHFKYTHHVQQGGIKRPHSLFEIF